jgi:UPF0755 protein
MEPEPAPAFEPEELAAPEGQAPEAEAEAPAPQDEPHVPEDEPLAPEEAPLAPEEVPHAPEDEALAPEEVPHVPEETVQEVSPAPVPELPPFPPAPAEPVAEAAPDAGPTPVGASAHRPRRPLPSARASRQSRVAGSLRPARQRPRRSLRGRLGAVLALAIAIVAVALLLRALLSSKHAKSAAAPAVVKVVIPEGKTRVQIAQITTKAGLRGSYLSATRRSSLLSPAQYGASRHTPDLEGFLFPATYDEYPGAPASRLVADQLVAFKENFGANLLARARSLHVTPYQMLTVASMVEREAQVPGDRAKIAAVIYNRLSREIPLGIDATIYYAVELQKGVATYTHELTESQLRINSPYNTRTHVGLPPTPIANPGLASIEAAANPARGSYLYYVAGADGCGEQVFSSTLAAFETNVAAYQAAVKKNGGHPPTCKK